MERCKSADNSPKYDDLRNLPLAKRRPVKITVLRTMRRSEVYAEEPDGISPEFEDVCPRFKAGQQMIVDKSGFRPDDFPCQWAWQDLYPIILTLQMGGNFFWLRDGLQYACCTDGLRPVFFKLERI